MSGRGPHDDVRRPRDDGYARRRSRSPARSSRDHDRRRSRSPNRSRDALPSQAVSFTYGKPEGERTAEDEVEAARRELLKRPDFKNSGKLAAETNTVRGVVLKYNEPPEARKPTRPWRLYVFKDSKEIGTPLQPYGADRADMIHLNRQSAYLFGRDRVVTDVLLEHPSASKQHAVIQFRAVSEKNEFGDIKSTVKPFIIDLESANGTTVAEETVPPSRFFELKSGDVIKFAFSLREYVLLPED